MVAEVPHLARIDVVPENAWTPVEARRYERRQDRGLGGRALSRQPGDAGERGDGGAGAAGGRPRRAGDGGGVGAWSSSRTASASSS